MKMEILLEPTSNKLMVEHAEYDESNTYVLERFNTSAGNPVKKILLKLNLSDHRLCKMVVECQSVKVKEFQERCNIKAFQEWYEHVGPEVASPQGGKVTSWRRDYAWLMISRCSRSLCQIQVQGTSSIQEVNDHYNIFTRERQEYELKTKDKAIGALEDDLKKTKHTYSSAYTKLILRVKKLEARVKIGKARRQARVVLSDDEDLEVDSSKQGRSSYLDAEVMKKQRTDMNLFIQEVTPTEVIQDQEGSEKASDEVSTASAKKGTASEEVPTVSTAKGKALIMIEFEPKKKSKKELEQERQWDEEERKRAMDEAKSTKKIDWKDPSDFNQNIEPMDAEHGSGKQKSPEMSPENLERMKSVEKWKKIDG
ncbi:hypothetical protein Tco_0382283 [Tanacetum coccineum]